MANLHMCTCTCVYNIIYGISALVRETNKTHLDSSIALAILTMIAIHIMVCQQDDDQCLATVKEENDQCESSEATDYDTDSTVEFTYESLVRLENLNEPISNGDVTAPSTFCEHIYTVVNMFCPVKIP